MSDPPPGISFRDKVAVPWAGRQKYGRQNFQDLKSILEK